MERKGIKVNVTIVSYFESNSIKRQRYNNVILTVIDNRQGKQLHFESKQKKFSVPVNKGTNHLSHLMSHGVFTIANHNPRQDYMIRTNNRADSIFLLNIIKGLSGKTSLNFSKSLPEVVKKDPKHLQDVAKTLKVPLDELTRCNLLLQSKKLTALPLAFGDLVPTTLNLDCNLLGPRLCYWSWVFGQIRHTLTSLSLSENRLKYFPMEILVLKKLRILNLANNDLRTVPSSLFCPNRGLQKLDIQCNNNLSYLPFINKKFFSLNVIGCNKVNAERNIEVRDCGMPDLKYLAGRIVLQHNLLYNSSNLPRILITYLNNHIECASCRKCAPKHALSKFVLSNSPAQETLSNSVQICFQHYQCFECLK